MPDWPPELRASIIDLRRTGVRPTAIATRLEMPVKRVAHMLACCPKAEKAHWPKLRPDIDCPAHARRNRRILALRSANLTYTSIARRVGVSKNSVAGVLARIREKQPPPPRPEPILTGCRWIESDPSRGPWQFCGQPTVRDPNGAMSAWCAEHRARAYRRITPSPDSGDSD